MPEPDTRAWWAEVEHLREPLARRREARTVKPSDGRRTVKIRGQAVAGAPSRKLRVAANGEELQVPSFAAARRRPPRRVAERLGSRPDRMAAWAVGCGLLLAIVAATTGHG